MTILVGDCRDSLAGLPAESVQCVVTSPPYFGLRDYGVDGQLGLEACPDCAGWATGAWCGACFVCRMVDVFRGVRRVLKADGVAWVNMGDSYAGSGRGGNRGDMSTLQGGQAHQDATRAARGRQVSDQQRDNTPAALGSRGVGQRWKAKDLLGVPWRLALALQAEGWYLRQDVVWHKPNPMPESVRDRCTKAHEYVFLLAKAESYYFDQDAILEPIAESSRTRLAQDLETQTGSDRANAGERRDGRPMKAVSRSSGNLARKPGSARGCPTGTGSNVCGNVPWEGTTRNKRTVWTVPTEKFSGAHFATYPQALVEPCILAGSRPGDVVLDPFLGSGTTALVAERLGRRWIGCELNPAYAELARERIRATVPTPGLALA
jgi:DNA modification methylase